MMLQNVKNGKCSVEARSEARRSSTEGSSFLLIVLGIQQLLTPVCLLQNLCFTKKIRYESRKQLAQARPRVKGQFVRVGDIADAVDALTENGKVCYLTEALPVLAAMSSLHCMPLVYARIRLL